MSEFLYMGGHWFFVWGSYIVTGAALLLLLWLPARRLRRLLNRRHQG